jgi:glutathione S-transferase
MHHLGLQIELQNVDFQSKQLESPEFRKLNPNGSIPLLQDGDFTVWESCAIMEYLCDKTGHTELYPQELKARTDINRWSYWTAYHFAPACGTFIWENLVKPMMKMGEPDAKILQEAKEDFHRYAKVLDDQLTNRNWVTGKNMTLADFNIGSVLMYVEGAKIPWENYSNIRGWYKRLESTDAWKKSAPPPMK